MIPFSRLVPKWNWGIVKGQSCLRRMETHDPTKTISNFAAFVICINYVVGTGIFRYVKLLVFNFIIHSLPFGFYSSGILLATVCLLISGALSLVCAYWVLEVLARTEGITSAVYDIQGQSNFIEGTSPVNEVTFRKFDFTRLFATYYGTPGAIIMSNIRFETVLSPSD